jgi:small subunit ribosomal protein S6
MRRYELMLLLRPDLEDDKLQASVEKVTRAIVNAGGSLSKVSPWGKRRLAYDIGKHREASYFLIHFDIEPSEIREIERGMLISEEIMRHLVTVLEDRGPADELAPAAAPRAGAAETDENAPDGGLAEEDEEETSEDTSEENGPEAGAQAAEAPGAEGAPAEQTPAEGTPVDERAEADRPRTREEPS